MRIYSVDPAEEQASPYTYCANNPVMLVNPDGMIKTHQHQLSLGLDNQVHLHISIFIHL